MILSDIIALVQGKLGEQNTSFYPEAEIVVQGINPAQRLMCLAHPPLNYVRTSVTLAEDVSLIDLRTLLDASAVLVGNRFRGIRRVVLGDVTGSAHAVSATTGELRQLLRTDIQHLSALNNWLTKRGEVRKYWLWGRYWMGVYKRPIASTTLTILYAAAPAPLALATPTGVPNIPAVYHPTIAEIATGLLLIKEGSPQSDRGMLRIKNGLGTLAHDIMESGTTAAQGSAA